jgi:hypothetical protein
VLGHPVIEQTLSLRSGVGRIDFGVGILKDPTPGLETVVVFPFDVPQGQFLLDEPLHVADPGKDRLPGAFSNRLVPQEWVSVCNDDIGILWSSLDAPTISIGSLWPHRVSPAHCGTPNDDLHLPPQSADDLRGGTLYSCICFNNMMTNFSVNQSGQLYFRYVIQSGPPCAGVEEGAVFGDQAVRPFASIFTKHPGARVLEPSQALLETDNRALRLLTFKKAEDGDGMILRLWNPTDKGIDTNISLPQHKIDSVLVCNVVEKTGDEHIACEDHSIPVKISANAIQTLRIVCQQ